MAMAIACLRLLTLPPFPPFPLLSSPCLNSCMTRPDVFLWLGDDFAMGLPPCDFPPRLIWQTQAHARGSRIGPGRTISGRYLRDARVALPLPCLRVDLPRRVGWVAFS